MSRRGAPGDPVRPLDRTDAKLLGFALVLVDLIGDAVVAGVLQ